MAEADLRIPETIEHRYDYDQEYISDILRSVKTIAMVFTDRSMSEMYSWS